jgi:hypothetical protein
VRKEAREIQGPCSFFSNNTLLEELHSVWINISVFEGGASNDLTTFHSSTS